MQIPLVDGDIWWKHVARVEKWPLQVGDPMLVDEVKKGVLKLFNTEKPKKAGKGKEASSLGMANPSPGSHVSM